MAASPSFAATPRMTPQKWTNADAATTTKTLFTAGPAGSKIVAINATSTDASARVFSLYQNRGGTLYLIGAGSVPADAGSDGATASYNLLALVSNLPKDQNGQVFFFLESTDTLQAINATQVTATKEVDIETIGADF